MGLAAAARSPPVFGRGGVAGTAFRGVFACADGCRACAGMRRSAGEGFCGGAPLGWPRSMTFAIAATRRVKVLFDGCLSAEGVMEFARAAAAAAAAAAVAAAGFASGGMSHMRRRRRFWFGLRPVGDSSTSTGP